MSLSRLSETCRECLYKYACNNKRMEALAHMPNMVSLTVPKTLPLTMPMIQLHDYRNVKIDKDTTVTMDLEEIKKKLNDQFAINMSRL